MDTRRIELSLSQDKINSINSALQKELGYWKDTALKRALDPNEANQLKDLAPPSFLLIHKAKQNPKTTGINKIISYLKSQYSTNNRILINLVQNFPGLEEVSSFEGIQKELKIISKHIKDGENMSLRNIFWTDSSRKDGIQAR